MDEFCAKVARFQGVHSRNLETEGAASLDMSKSGELQQEPDGKSTSAATIWYKLLEAGIIAGVSSPSAARREGRDDMDRKAAASTESVRDRARRQRDGGQEKDYSRWHGVIWGEYVEPDAGAGRARCRCRDCGQSKDAILLHDEEPDLFASASQRD